MKHMDLVIASIIKNLKEYKKEIGKIQIQKFVYFLKNMGITVPYNFHISHYGPYSAELSEKINDMEFNDIIFREDANGKNYDINKDINYTNTNGELLKELKTKIEFLKDVLPSLEFRDLELYSTVHYCYSALKLLYKDITERDLIDEVKLWKKDKFSDDEILKAYQNLKNNKLLGQ